MAFCGCGFIVFSRCVDVVVPHSFLRLNNIPLDIPNFMYSSLDRPLGCSHFLATMSSVAMGIQVHIFVWTCVISFINGSRNSPVLRMPDSGATCTCSGSSSAT